MKVFRSLDEVPPGRRAVAIGIFDGVHIGHQAVIRDALEWGRRNRAKAAVLTFDPHPATVLRPGRVPGLITSLEAKTQAVAALGCEEMLVIGFDESFSLLGREEFCHGVLLEGLGAVRVSVGANFHFGHGATGTAGYLVSQGPALGFEAHVVDLIRVDGKPVSSTRVRRAVSEGAVAEAATLMGRWFELDGVVVEGERRGRGIGYPTANILPDPGRVMPGGGVYAALANGDKPAAVNVGSRPTFGTDGAVVVEAHLLDFDRDLYGERLRLAFVERLRDEVRFETVEALVGEMDRDVERVRAAVGARGAQGRVC